jgi:hypothetical protein
MLLIILKLTRAHPDRDFISKGGLVFVLHKCITNYDLYTRLCIMNKTKCKF